MSKGRNSAHAFVDQLARAYSRLGAAGKSVLLAVSGGADSTALLLGSAYSAPRLRLQLQVACLNHGLREEAEAEVESVRKLSQERNLPFHTRSLNVSHAPGIEARSRALRYGAFEAIRSEARLDLVATAHTGSDQAETVLMRLARGSAARGAAGILEERGRIIRPMLGFLRREVEAFLGAEGTSFSEDPMNDDPGFFRTRVRRDVLPMLAAAAGESSVRALARFAHLQSEDAALLDALAEEAYARLQVGPNALDAAGLRALLPPLRRRVLGRLLDEIGAPWNYAAIERAMSAVASGRGAPLARHYTLRAESGVVRLLRRSPRRTGHPPVELCEGWNEDPVSGLRIAVSGTPPIASSALWIHVESPRLPMFLRRRAPGDRIVGSFGQRRLQDVLVDEGVRSELRDVIPIICDAQGKILWVVGVWPRRTGLNVDVENQGATPPSDRWYLSAESLVGGIGAWIPTSL